MSTRRIGDGADLAAAWNDLGAALAAVPGWALVRGFYIANSGAWGCKLFRPDGGHLYVVAPDSGTPADAFRRAARYVPRGELVEYINDFQP